MSEYYRLEGRNVVPVASTKEWATYYEGSRKDRIVKQEYVGDKWVSTVFLSLDHSFVDGPPILFETMVFAAPDGKVSNWGELERERCSTYEEAEAQHAAMVKRLADSSTEGPAK